MVDYQKTKAEFERRKAQLLERQQQIPDEKKKLDVEQEENKRELIGIDQVLDGFAFMESDVPPDCEPSGFTDSIRKILSETPVPLVPTQIRDVLEAKGIKGSSSKNLLINVHKVIERISSELIETMNPDGKKAYQRPAVWQPRSALSNLAIAAYLGPFANVLPPLPPEIAKLEEKVQRANAVFENWKKTYTTKQASEKNTFYEAMTDMALKQEEGKEKK